MKTRRKGGGGHLKREVAPSFWPVHKKEAVWSVKPMPGPHAIHRCIPLGIIVRDVLGLADTRREAKKIVSQGKIFVDGRPRRDDRFPVGLMDVVSIPEVKKSYRVVPSEKGLTLHPIAEDEASFKICRIENKRTVKNGHIEVNLHDGRNFLIRVEDPSNPREDIYRTLDTLRISIPDQEVLEHFRVEKGMFASLVDGANIGKFGAISSITEERGQKRRKWLVTIEDREGRSYQTILDYVFVIGDETPRISLPNLEGAEK